MKGKIAKLLACLGLLGVMLTTVGLGATHPEVLAHSQLKRFASYEELVEFLQASASSYPCYYFFSGNRMLASLESSGADGADSSLPPDYSLTNIQVEGVDEADIIKTDGEFIYLVVENKVIIVKAYPPEEAQLLSEIEFEGNPKGIFINGDRLVVFEEETSDSYETLKTTIKVYDVSDRENPLLKREVSVDGLYWGSRMITDYTYEASLDGVNWGSGASDYVYVLVNKPAYANGDEVSLPMIDSGDGPREIPASEISYADVSDYYYTFITIAVINIGNDDEEAAYETLLLGAASNLYVSLNNIYITFTEYGADITGLEKTSIHRIRIEGSDIEYDASGEVPGRLLNQFSMDEHQGYFRVATTTGYLSRSWGEASSRNHLYVLDENLVIVGKLEDLAPGEEIYSARFMGNRCYLVTFRKIDPLFVIDLKNPCDPRVLGQLKITGYSDYLHPYDENHVIGIGKETVAAEGNFAWYQGVKISLFDVSEVDDPREVAKYEIGDRGTDSPVLNDHKALLFDRAKNLLTIPVMVAEIDEGQYPYEVPPYAYGEYIWQGIYVFDISLEDGLVLKGKITHHEDGTDLGQFGYYYSSPYSVERSLYIGDVLYTISDMKIKMHSLENLDYVNEVVLG